MITKLVLKNFMRFRGEHVLTLARGVHAVVASWEGDEGRSNWGGKSSALTAIPFALFGWHTSPTEDAWITNDENDGYVELHLDDGTEIRRERKRGKSTQLRVERGTSPAGGFVANGDEAQKLIEQIVGLSEKDFFATCFFEQRQIAKLVLARPGERMEIAAAWFGLEPLKRCEENIRNRLNGQTAKDVALGQRAEVVKQLLQEVRTRSELDEGSDLPEALKAQLADLVAEVTQGEKELKEAEHVANVVQKAADYARLQEDGKRIKTDAEQVGDAKALAEMSEAIELDRTDKLVKVSEKSRELRSTETLARGSFGGACPVVPDFVCPAQDQINAMKEDHRTRLPIVKQEVEKAQIKLDDATMKQREVASQEAKLKRAEGQLEVLRDQARALKPARTEWEELGSPEKPDLDLPRASLRATEVAKRETEKDLEAVKKWIAELGQIRADQDAISTTISTHRLALQVFGRNGAQRKIAEGALGEIQVGANTLLVEAGIDLKVAVIWAREGQGLASHCDSCGAPFPSSTKVKACERCKAERGPKLVERLDIELSDRSGAAEDLAGVALQLAAATWLRRARGASWDVCCIDEAFGQLDPSHRRALGMHLAAMLTGKQAFSQAFVVAHDTGTLDALPHRVSIVAEESGSRFA